MKDGCTGCTPHMTSSSAPKRGRGVTRQSLNPTSPSACALVLDIAAPSLEATTSLQVFWSSELASRFERGSFPSGELAPPPLTNGKPATVGSGSLGSMFAVAYGMIDALGPCPLHGMASTLRNKDDNISTSMSVQDVLPVPLRICDVDEREQYASTTPSNIGLF